MLIITDAHNNILNNLICSSNECLCWIIILLNILAIFYLVLCSFYKITKLTRMIGWIYGGILIIGTIGIVAIHTCLFSILCTIFTVMIFMAILSIILPNNEKNNKENKSCGSYVIEKENHGYAFALYDVKKVLLVKSFRTYNTLNEVREAINYCRDNGAFAEVEDRLLEWVQKREHPKFIVYNENKMYYFRLMADVSNIIIQSSSYYTIKQCRVILNKVIESIKTTNTYILADIVDNDDVLVEEHLDKNTDNNDLEIMNNEKKDDMVVLQKTFDEKYNDLSNKQKKYFNDLDSFVKEKENIKSLKSKNHIIYKIGIDKLIIIRINNGFVEVMINLINDEYKKMNKSIKIKEKLTTIKLINNDYYSYIISLIELRYKTLMEKRIKNI